MDIYPGKAINLSYYNTNKNIFLLKSKIYPSYCFYLNHHSYNIDIKHIEAYKYLIIKPTKNGIFDWEIIPTSFEEECQIGLFQYLYCKGIGNNLSNSVEYPWTEIWNRTTQPNLPHSIKSIKRIEEHANGWSKWIAKSNNEDMIPLRGKYSTHIIDDSKAIFSPVPISSGFSSISSRKECFQDVCIDWPKKYTATIKGERNGDISTILILYPPVDIIKLHKCVRQHVYGERTRWEAKFLWGPVNANFSECKISCNNCRKANSVAKITEIQNKLLPDIIKYYSSGITFFTNAQTLSSRVEIKKHRSGLYFAIDITIREYQSTSDKRDGKTICLRGWGYNQYSCFHIHLLTIYAGIQNDNNSLPMDMDMDMVETGIITNLTPN